jgi:poly(A) polymerase
MTAPATTAVLDALEAAGGADCVRFVGGCVRNAVIGRPIADIDLATTLPPAEVTAALKAAGVRAVPTGVEHGTVTAIYKHQPIEVTTLRRDVETDGRRAVVAFTTDWREDAERRDFTLNALYARRDGTLFDPTGHGVADARAGRIVFVGDPLMRLREDHLRSLRFFRFLAWYGRGEPDAAAIAAVIALKDQVAILAAERISAELLKLLAAEDPRAAARLMHATGVLPAVLPGPLDLDRLEALVEIELSLGETDALARLAALLPDDQAEAVRSAERLRLSNAERDRLAAALAPAPQILPGSGSIGSAARPSGIGRNSTGPPRAAGRRRPGARCWRSPRAGVRRPCRSAGPTCWLRARPRDPRWARRCGRSRPGGSRATSPPTAPPPWPG